MLLRRLFFRLALAGAALILWSLPAEAQQKPLFQEKFSGKLSAGWTWI